MESNLVKNHLHSVMLELSDKIPTNFFRDNLFFAGGAIRSLVNNETPKDYDIFVRSSEALEQLNLLLIDKFLYKSINATAVKTPTGKEVQFILMTSGTPQEVIGEFDFLMNMNYYDPKLEELIIHWSTFDKKLRVNPKARNILGTLARIPKFVARGFEIPDAQDLVTLGIRASKLEPITKTSQLVSHCRLASCVSTTIILNNELEEDADLSSIIISLRGSNA